ncbi:MAG: LPS assembly lipoprotein LptE [Syntrophobacteraceae bacterium]|nr:LPS assembly lipoprotein LptE [Syntrophobacteraceae bacterium]
MRRSTQRFCLTMALFALLLGGGCGYRFSGEGEGPRPGLKKLAISVFENLTSEPELGSMFAGELRRQFMTRGDIQVVEVDDAEMVFKGRVTQIYSSSVAHRAFERRFQTRLTLEARLYVTLDVRCEDARTGTVLWRDPKFTDSRVFSQNPDPANLDPILTFDNRHLALEFLARDMAIKIHDRFMSNF